MPPSIIPDLPATTRSSDKDSNTATRPPIQTTTNIYNQPTDDPFIRNVLTSVPDFVLSYAPLVHLHTQEPFWPACHESHLRHSTLIDSTGKEIETPSSCTELFKLLAHSKLNHENCYMTAREDIRSRPSSHSWLVSEAGKPGPDGHSKVSPATLILVDKSEMTGIPNTLDAFWFFFYSFNLGPTVAKIHFGNHIADWEHCMVRFIDGKPSALHLSSHADGFAYTYDCLEKRGIRPVIYSAFGSHAMYPKAGSHDYSPVKLIGPVDKTDRGPIWDPSLNMRCFQHFPSPARDKFKAIDEDRDGAFVACLQFRGQWGDQYSVVEGNWARRKLMLDSLRWGDGVTGPRDKDLDRIGMNRFHEKIRTSIH